MDKSNMEEPVKVVPTIDLPEGVRLENNGIIYAGIGKLDNLPREPHQLKHTS